jgi:hypothetical protein
MANRLDYDLADATPRIWLGAAIDARIVFIQISVVGTTEQYPHREGSYVDGCSGNNASGAVIWIISIMAIVSRMPIVLMIRMPVINLFSDRRRLDDSRVHNGDRPGGGIAYQSRCEESDA